MTRDERARMSELLTIATRVSLLHQTSSSRTDRDLESSSIPVFSDRRVLLLREEQTGVLRVVPGSLISRSRGVRKAARPHSSVPSEITFNDRYERHNSIIIDGRRGRIRGARMDEYD